MSILVITRPIVEAAIVKCSQLTAAVIIEGFATKKVLIIKSATSTMSSQGPQPTR